MAKKPKLPEPELYSLDLSPSQHEEIDALLALAGVEAVEEMPRVRWIAVGLMCLGKAQQLDDGYYGDECEDAGFDPDEWASELREIAELIFEEFQPGDNKL